MLFVGMEITEEGLENVFTVLFPVFDERQHRLVSGGATRLVGYGGITLIA